MPFCKGHHLPNSEYRNSRNTSPSNTRIDSLADYLYTRPLHIIVLRLLYLSPIVAQSCHRSLAVSIYKYKRFETRRRKVPLSLKRLRLAAHKLRSTEYQHDNPVSQRCDREAGYEHKDRTPANVPDWLACGCKAARVDALGALWFGVRCSFLQM